MSVNLILGLSFTLDPIPIIHLVTHPSCTIITVLLLPYPSREHLLDQVGPIFVLLLDELFYVHIRVLGRVCLPPALDTLYEFTLTLAQLIPLQPQLILDLQELERVRTYVLERR